MSGRDQSLQGEVRKTVDLIGISWWETRTLEGRESGITSLLEVIGLEKSFQKRSEVADSKGMSIDH